MALWEVMKSKNFLILTLFFLATSISIWLVSVPTPSIHNIVRETHKQISNLKNINVMTRLKRPQIELDSIYLELLGFIDKPRLYPASVGADSSVPVVVTAVREGNYENAFALIASVQKYLVGHPVVVYDLGLRSSELLALKKHCNETSRCSVKSFDFDKFPSWVKVFGLEAYKPIAIQESLNEYGAIVWTNDEQYFISGEFSGVFGQANDTGIVAWTIKSKEPTSALTHPKMFDYFKTRQEKYIFHHMVSSDHLVLYNTRRVHHEVMLPWVQCVLTTECLWPVGAQSSGCNYQRKPKYKYSGCHHSASSALNVILGTVFAYDETPYTTYKEIFGIEAPPLDYDNTTMRTTLAAKATR